LVFVYISEHKDISNLPLIGYIGVCQTYWCIVLSTLTT